MIEAIKEFIHSERGKWRNVLRPRYDEAACAADARRMCGQTPGITYDEAVKYLRAMGDIVKNRDEV